jgi:hypothetical protein
MILHTAISYFVSGFLWTCLLLHIYYIYKLWAEQRRLQRDTYNAYMNMVQGMREDEYHAHLFEDSIV